MVILWYEFPSRELKSEGNKYEHNSSNSDFNVSFTRFFILSVCINTHSFILHIIIRCEVKMAKEKVVIPKGYYNYK